MAVALQRIEALPYTFSPALMRDRHVARVRTVCARYRISLDDVVATLRGAAPPPAGVPPFLVLHAAALWALPPVRFGRAMGDDAARHEEQSISQAAHLLRTACSAAAACGGGGCPPAHLADLYATAADVVAQAGGDGAGGFVDAALRAVPPADPASLSAEELAAQLYALRVVARVGFPGALPAASQKTWLELLRRHARSAGCADAFAAFSEGRGLDSLVSLVKSGAVGTAYGGGGARREGRCAALAAAATDVGFELVSRNVLVRQAAFALELRAELTRATARVAEASAEERAETATALLAAVAQAALAGWVHFDRPDDEEAAAVAAEEAEPLFAALHTLLYDPVPAALRTLRRYADGGEEGLGAVVAAEGKARTVLATRLRETLATVRLGMPEAEEKAETETVAKVSVDDATLEAFYDRHPYPVWFAVGTSGLPVYDSYLAYLKAYLPKPLSKNLSWATSAERVLIAGCGSGHQIALALAQYTKTPLVKGIDLSRVNLRYAAERLAATEPAGGGGQRRWALEQGDLSAAPPAGEEEAYDVAECCGVLHHCKDPTAALRALLRRVKRGGVVVLGVYAASGTEPVRRCIDYVYETFKVSEASTPSLAQIREVREGVCGLPTSHPVRRVLEGQLSFHSAAPFCDMLFHPRAHYFTLPELRRLTEDVGAELLAVSFDSCQADISARLKYATAEPADEAMRSWKAWEEVEQKGVLQSLPWHNLILRKP